MKDGGVFGGSLHSVFGGSLHCVFGGVFQCVLYPRIVLVRQTGEELNSTRSFNGSLVEVVMRSILPPTHHILSAQEVAESMEACLREGAGAVWPSWTVSRWSIGV